MNKKHRKSSDGSMLPDKRRKPVTVTDILAITLHIIILHIIILHIPYMFFFYLTSFEH